MVMHGDLNAQNLLVAFQLVPYITSNIYIYKIHDHSILPHCVKDTPIVLKLLETFTCMHINTLVQHAMHDTINQS